MQNRLANVQEMLNILYLFLDRVEQGLSCISVSALRDDKEACLALSLGSLVRGFNPIGQCILRPDASSVHGSALVLSSIKIYTWEVGNAGKPAHTPCNFCQELASALAQTFKNIKSPVLDSHSLHMTAQWAKGQPSGAGLVTDEKPQSICPCRTPFDVLCLSRQ